MSLYDQVNQTNTPFMSQFVGSIVPEVNAYAGTMQKRYDTAADSDDALGEALGNLQHLGLDADTQYANELKNTYYQKLQERAKSGDFENMGRRTRQDAIRFSQAYQPLIQRQKDYAEVVKKIQADDTIADPATKRALIEKFQYDNATQRDPLTGDFERDATGRVKLNGIQDAVYASDVDINKILLDELSKKEADISAGRYFSDGHGNLINTIEKVRDPRYIAQLANQLQMNDPKIKAMITRDVNLRTYRMTPDEIRQQLKDSGLAKSEYEVKRSQGLNSHEIGRASKVAPLDMLKEQYIRSGMSEEAAERAILNSQVEQSMRNSHSTLVGGILGYRQESNDNMTDHMAVIRATAAATNIKDPNLLVVDGNTSTTYQQDPLKTAKSYVDVKKDLQVTASNTTTALVSALKATGMSSGNEKTDLSTAIAAMHNPVKLNAIKTELAKTHPKEAQILESLGQAYQQKAAVAGIQEGKVQELEKAGGINWDALYKEYSEGEKVRSIKNIFNSKSLSKEDFIDQVRSYNNNLFKRFIAHIDHPLQYAAQDYTKVIEKGQKAIIDGTSQAAGYHPIVPTGPGKTDRLTDAVTNLALSNGITGIDLNDPEAGPVDITKAMGIDASNYADKVVKAQEKGFKIHFNTESVDGKPTVTVRAADGTSRIYQTQNLPASIQDELNLEVRRAGQSAPTTAYGQRLAKQGLAGFGATEMTDITPQYLKTVNPGASGVLKRLNDNFSTKITDVGGGNRRYTLLTNEADGSHKPTGYKFDSVDDLTVALGKYRSGNVVSPAEQTVLNTQR